MRLSPDGRFVYVTSEDDAEVAVIARASNRAVKRLKVANGPFNDVSVIDAEKQQVIARIADRDRPWGVAVVPAEAFQ